jgi:DNA-binding transcriptional ArsR family regulator
MISMVVEQSESVRTRELARVFKALGDSNRMAIFQLLRERCCSGCHLTDEGAERTVSEIAKAFDLALSTVSHHIKELRNAGLIRCERDGQRVYCSVNDKLLRELKGFFIVPKARNVPGKE